MQKTARVCSISLKHSSSGARNIPCLNIIISSSAGEELPKGNVTFPATLACLERAFVAMWNGTACIIVLWEEEVFCRANGNKTLPWLGVQREWKSRAGSEMGSWPQSEQKSEHPGHLASCDAVAKAEPRCFQPCRRPAGSLQEEINPFHKERFASNEDLQKLLAEM